MFAQEDSRTKTKKNTQPCAMIAARAPHIVPETEHAGRTGRLEDAGNLAPATSQEHGAGRGAAQGPDERRGDVNCAVDKEEGVGARLGSGQEGHLHRRDEGRVREGGEHDQVPSLRPPGSLRIDYAAGWLPRDSAISIDAAS